MRQPIRLALISLILEKRLSVLRASRKAIITDAELRAICTMSCAGRSSSRLCSPRHGSLQNSQDNVSARSTRSTANCTHSRSQSFTNRLAQSLRRSVAQSLRRSLAHSLAHSLARSLTRSITHSLTHSLTHSFTRSLAHPLTHSLAHSLTYSLKHSLDEDGGCQSAWAVQQNRQLSRKIWYGRS